MTIGTRVTREALFTRWAARGLDSDKLAPFKEDLDKLLALVPEKKMPLPSQGEYWTEGEQMAWIKENDRRLHLMTVFSAVLLAEMSICVACGDGDTHYELATKAFGEMGSMLGDFLKVSKRTIEGYKGRPEKHRGASVRVLSIPLGSDLGEALTEVLKALSEGPDTGESPSPQPPSSPEAKGASPGDPDRPLDGWPVPGPPQEGTPTRSTLMPAGIDGVPGTADGDTVQ